MKNTIAFILFCILLSSCTSSNKEAESEININNLYGFWRIDSVLYSDNRTPRYFNSGFEISNYNNDNTFNIYVNSLDRLIEKGKYELINDTIIMKYEHGNIMNHYITKLTSDMIEISDIHYKDSTIWRKIYYSRYSVK
jgi:hypothetical protein